MALSFIRVASPELSSAQQPDPSMFLVYGCFPARPSEPHQPQDSRSSSHVVVDQSKTVPNTNNDVSSSTSISNPLTSAQAAPSTQTNGGDHTYAEQAPRGASSSSSPPPPGICHAFFYKGSCERQYCSYRHSTKESIEREEEPPASSSQPQQQEEHGAHSWQNRSNHHYNNNNSSSPHYGGSYSQYRGGGGSSNYGSRNSSNSAGRYSSTSPSRGGDRGYDNQYSSYNSNNRYYRNQQ